MHNLLRREDHLGAKLAGDVFLCVGGHDSHEEFGVFFPGEAFDGEGEP